MIEIVTFNKVLLGGIPNYLQIERNFANFLSVIFFYRQKIDSFVVVLSPLLPTSDPKVMDSCPACTYVFLLHLKSGLLC